ncbi:MAG: UvrABC system protein C [Patescibacteria group bacterium]|nr:MAG: UvrABC system protein C [Patescibacteria group bacterium]
MVSLAQTVKHKVLESELQALLVEAELIRTYQPEYNTLLKDDKSPLYIEITDEVYPRVLKVRKKELQKKQRNGTTVLGPFPSAYKTNEVLNIARKIFPWCNKKLAHENRRNKDNQPCFYYHLDLCPGACIGEISPGKYNENIQNLIHFLRGKKKLVTDSLQQKMGQAIETQNYEEAAVVRDQLKLIAEVTSKQHKLKPELTTAALKEQISEDGVIYLQKILSQYLGLPKQMPLTRIEGYDVSNIQGTNPAVSLVTFTNGQPDTDQYRIFNIKTLNTPNDFHMLQEAIVRRQNHPEWGTPNLVLIDGGKGQVKSVLKLWKWYVPVIGIAKNPDRLVLPYYETQVEHGRKISNLKYHLVKLDSSHPTLKLIQQIRDESHRFAQKQHKKKRLTAMFE